jgi:hypothetical protein
MRGAKIGLNLKIEIEKALEDGACHPEGIRGWLIDCARSTKTADRQIFAAIVAKLLPSHLVTSNQHNITINLGWLADRKVEQDQHVIDGVSEPTDVPTAERDGE